MTSVTLRDVANRAGVSVSTASAALNGAAIVRVKTRKRVESAAAEIGYRKDASAAVLASRQRRAKKSQLRLTLGYVAGPGSSHKKSESFFECARQRGYDVEWLIFDGHDLPETASHQLWNRSVVGLFLAAPRSVPVVEEWTAKFDWERFSVVKFSRARPELRFDLIRHSAFDYMSRTVREVASRGYRRLAVLMARSEVGLDDEARLGAVLAWASLSRPREVRLTWRIVPDEQFKRQGLSNSVMSWLRKFEPDVVISFPEIFYWKLQEMGYRIPQEVSFASVIVNSHGAAFAGCLDDHDLLASKAVALLDQKIRFKQLGMVAVPQETVIEPLWFDHPTLPSVCS